MGYYSDVRVVVTKDGLKRLRELVRDELEASGEDYNLLDNAVLKYNSSYKQVMLCWDYLKWYDYYKDVDAVMQALDNLHEEGYSYCFSRIGEDMSDIDEFNYEGDNEDEVEYPWVHREFDDAGSGFYELEGDEKI